MGDPHAAQMVFRSGVPVVMCGLDATMKAYLTPAVVDEIGGRGTVTLGKTVTDLWSDKQFADQHVFVVLDVDRDRFTAKVRKLLASY